MNVLKLIRSVTVLGAMAMAATASALTVCPDPLPNDPFPAPGFCSFEKPLTCMTPAMNGRFSACTAASGQRSILANLISATPTTAKAHAMGFSSIGGGICNAFDSSPDGKAVPKDCRTPQTVTWGGRLEF